MLIQEHWCFGWIEILATGSRQPYPNLGTDGDHR
jgi:hypothetical protein